MSEQQFPGFLASLFWDSDFRSLSWAEHRDFIVRRILQSGSWAAITWLRAEVGDPELRHWIEGQDGAGLSPRQLRFWEVVLDLPHPEVTQWVQKRKANPWGRRLS